MAGKPLVDRTGDRYGMLTVIARAENYRGNAQWRVQCDCGRVKTYIGQDLARGKVRSCGCNNPMYATEHGMASTPTYRIWVGMRARCRNENHAAYHHYGGRGIKVHKPWDESFSNFFADMGACPPGRSLDRINNDGDYEPGNCRWATMKEQLNNTRVNRIVEINGRSQTLAQWCDEIGISRSRVQDRMKWGWTVERALTEPVRKTRPTKSR